MIASLLLFLNLIPIACVGKGVETYKHLAHEHAKLHEDVHQMFVGDSLIDKTILENFSYNSLVNPKYVKGFDKIFFLKSFLNYESQTTTALDSIRDQIAIHLGELKEQLDEFVKTVGAVLAFNKQFPPHYIQSKARFLLNKALKFLDPNFIPDPVDQPQEQIFVYFQNEEKILAEFGKADTDLDYLVQARGQMVMAMKVAEYDSLLKFFREALPKTLRSILVYALGNLSKKYAEDAQLRYLVDFFNVFGRLVGEKQLAEIILNEIVPNEGPMTYQSADFPKVLADKDLYDYNSQGSSVDEFISADKLHNFADDVNTNLLHIMDAMRNRYTYHPQFIRFFDFTNKKNPLKSPKFLTNPNSDTEANEKRDNGLRNIQKVYFFVRTMDAFPKGLKTETELVDYMYDIILQANFYKDEDARPSLANLMSREVFEQYYLIMLTLLKPSSSKPESAFSPDDLKVIADNIKEMKGSDVLQHVDLIKDQFPELPKSVTQKIGRKLIDRIGKIFDDPQTGPEIKKDDEAIDPVDTENKLQKFVMDNEPELEKIIQDELPHMLDLDDPETDPEESLEMINDLLEAFKDDKEVRDPLSDPEDLVKDALDNFLIPVVEKIFNKPDLSPKSVDMIEKLRDRFLEDVLEKVDHHGPLKETSVFFRFIQYVLMSYQHDSFNNLPAFGSSEITKLFNEFSEEEKRLLQIDIYVFYYRKLAGDKQNAQANKAALQIAADVFRNLFDFEIDDPEFVNIIYSYKSELLYMTRFFELFDLFLDEKAANTEHNAMFRTHEKILARLYKFLIKVRASTNGLLYKPHLSAYKILNICMMMKYAEHFGEQYSHDMAQYQEYDSKAACDFSYAELSEFYPYVTVFLGSKHPEAVKTMHMEFVQDHDLVDTQEFFKHLLHETENTKFLFGRQFDSFCKLEAAESFDFEDLLCAGHRLFTAIRNNVNNKQQEITFEEVFTELDFGLNIRSSSYKLIVMNTLWAFFSERISSLLDIGKVQQLQVSLEASYRKLEQMMQDKHVEKKRAKVAAFPRDYAELLAVFVSLKFRPNNGTIDKERRALITQVESLFGQESTPADKKQTPNGFLHYLASATRFRDLVAKFYAQHLQQFHHYVALTTKIIASKRETVIFQWNYDVVQVVTDKSKPLDVNLQVFVSKNYPEVEASKQADSATAKPKPFGLNNKRRGLSPVAKDSTGAKQEFNIDDALLSDDESGLRNVNVRTAFASPARKGKI